MTTWLNTGKDTVWLCDSDTLTCVLFPFQTFDPVCWCLTWVPGLGSWFSSHSCVLVSLSWLHRGWPGAGLWGVQGLFVELSQDKFCRSAPNYHQGNLGSVISRLRAHSNLPQNVRQDPDNLGCFFPLRDYIDFGVFLKIPRNLDLGEILKVIEPNPQLIQERASDSKE